VKPYLQKTKKQLWIPEGFAHGFLTLSDTAEFLYKTTDYFAKEYERAIRWDDEALSIGWPTDMNPVVSGKGAIATGFNASEIFA
jgi:dTDP-4-dehydrorhamnose 3,5-epimerase